ncbi:MAG TPA: ABC transporter substrate-binding protein [Rhodopila sp.]|nr:ABC transporter substrate-binding protein [Rhodopila sp.]
MPILLRTALGRYPHTEALRSGRLGSSAFTLVFEDINPVNRAFAPMVRELRFDVCEMAIGTFLQALAYDKPLVLLPVTVAARFQESALICRTDSGLTGPDDLRGRRVGIRAYSQTTGLWLRGTLQDQFGISPDAIEWVTFEDAHVSEYRDPPWATRAPQDASLLGMLREGRLDAVIMGNDLPDDPTLRTVFPDPAAAAETFLQTHGFMPVNHLVCVPRQLAAQQPDAIVALMRLFRSTLGDQTGLPIGRTALTPAVALAVRHAAEQGLLPRPLTAADVWTGLPDDPVFG